MMFYLCFVEITNRSCARHELGHIRMKKKMIMALGALVIIVVVIVGLYSFFVQTEDAETVNKSVPAHVDSQGKHCTYTVGCNCSGFSPKTSGDEWEKAYCRRCGHHKKYHR